MFINKHKIPWDLLATRGKKDICVMTKLGYYLKTLENLGENEKINVSKIWVNSNTYKKLEDYFLQYLKVHSLSVKEAKRKLGFYSLQLGPAEDFSDNLNLEDDFIYLKEDFKQP